MAGGSPILGMLSGLDAAAVDQWFAARRGSGTPLPYASVDLRHSGEKLVPVDTNIFPAGFNNLTPQGRTRASIRFRDYLARHFPDVRDLLIIPENHTRNQGYLDNLGTLVILLREAGAEVTLGRVDLPAGERFAFDSAAGHFEAVALQRDGDRLLFDDGSAPGLILLNHDLTAGIPPLLDGVSQPIVPPPSLGWWQRKKSGHFAVYDRVAREFADVFGIDPWRITAGFRQCGTINFREHSGLECVAIGIEAVLHSMREKYKEHGLASDPYVFIKADSGTYGMGIMTARSGDEVYAINKKTRNKMNAVKDSTTVTEVVIQEGVPTLDLIDGGFAEPVVYLVDGQAVGAVWRVNAERSAENNLNAAGMRFAEATDPEPGHCLIARLAALAASREEMA